MNKSYKRLQDVGCRYLQIDEPLFALASDDEVQAAVDSINLSIEGLGKMSVQVHICQGNYAVGADYDGQIGHRYFDTGRYPAALICKINCDVLLIEGDMAPHYKDLPGNKRLAVGVCNVQDMNAESAEELASRIRQLSWLAPEQTMITSSRGMNHLPSHRIRKTEGDGGS